MLPANALLGAVTAPEFPGGLPWLNVQRPLRLAELRGKFVLLDFWSYCCINCMHVLPELARLEAKYARELVVIGVHSGKFSAERDTEQIRNAILRYQIRHPVVNDADYRIWEAYAVDAWPTLVLINPLGKIIARSTGEGVFEPYDALLAQAIPYFEARGQLKRDLAAFKLEAAPVRGPLLFPGKVASDEKRGRLFISDSNNHRILITDASGKVLDVIGNGAPGSQDGNFEGASFRQPQGVSAAGELLYIADTENHLIRVADLSRRSVSTVLGTGLQARRFNQPGRGRSVALNSPWDVLALDGKLYIAMAGFHQLWVANVQGWDARPFAGSGREALVDGPAAQAALAQPSGLAAGGGKLYFADSESSAIREVDLTAGVVRTLVGKGLFDFGDKDGPAPRAQLQHPLGVSWRDGLLYIADTYNSKIKVLDPAGGRVQTLAGTGNKHWKDGRFAEAAFNEPGGLAWLAGKLYVADTNNHRIRVLDPVTQQVTTLEITRLEAVRRPNTQ